MQRRKFIKTTALSAVAVSATGFIRFDGNHYVSDCETTSDILGPFYRPDSPVRNNLVKSGAKGDLIELAGMVIHNDCVTPCKHAKIELWHCDGDGVYDNSSSEYRYRGTTFTDEKGNYSFSTILPVPYNAGGGLIRPAHFHLMITTESYTPLVTQLYFLGDRHIQKDPWASSANAKRRILKVQQLSSGNKRVLFNISLAGKIAAEPASINQLIGTYTDERDKNRKAEVFRKNDFLWLKNDVFGNKFEYAGNNSFKYHDESGEMKWTLHFEIIKAGSVKLTETRQEGEERERVSVFIKEK